MNFKELLKKDFIIMDGALGTEIQRLKKGFDGFSPLLNFDEPELIKNIIKSYAESGSDIVCSNTFGINKIKLEKYGITVDEAVKQAIFIAREACQGFESLVALDVSPIGQLLEPMGTLSFEDAYDIYKEIMLAGEKYGADLIIAETMIDLYELKAALLACKENTSLPIICSMSFEKNNRTFTRCQVSCMVETLVGLGTDAIGVNCSLGPVELTEITNEFLRWSSIPVMLKPNAGLPNPESGIFSLSPENFAFEMKRYAEKGVKLLGGCCGTSPQFIKRLRESLETLDNTVKRPNITVPSAVCSSSVTVEINRPRIIGERINPTGKKLFKEALKNSDLDYILKQAIEQVNAGAEILDINVGLPEIDEKQMMVKVVKAVQSICDAPLQIDSTRPDVIQAALRVYNGKAIVNSVNGDDEVLDSILPIVKKYGAAVVGLTLDKNGIPKKASERVRIAGKILERTLSYGIKREDVYIDCLTLTVSAEQEGAVQTLEAVRLVKEKLGLKTVLGVSNISFGLPNREIVNSTFLTMALASGLDLPIMNPNSESMMGAVRAYSLLVSHDKHATEFISLYSKMTQEPNVNINKENTKNDIPLEYAVSNGLKSDAAEITKRLLDIENPMDVISKRLIPTLDDVGKEFEKGKLFLPQLILAAEAAGACFDIIKKKLIIDGETPVIKGKIILATVKGDIHDIGKNIVKVLLENYGYQIIDLGKDVPETEVLDSVKTYNVKLVGLSALMTNTLPAMERTISLIKSEVPDCIVMVGGAVLNENYALKIGADFYASDAKGAIDIAKKVFN